MNINRDTNTILRATSGWDYKRRVFPTSLRFHISSDLVGGTTILTNGADDIEGSTKTHPAVQLIHSSVTQVRHAKSTDKKVMCDFLDHQFGNAIGGVETYIQLITEVWGEIKNIDYLQTIGKLIERAELCLSAYSESSIAEFYENKGQSFVHIINDPEIEYGGTELQSTLQSKDLTRIDRESLSQEINFQLLHSRLMPKLETIKRAHNAVPQNLSASEPFKVLHSAAVDFMNEVDAVQTEILSNSRF